MLHHDHANSPTGPHDHACFQDRTTMSTIFPHFKDRTTMSTHFQDRTTMSNFCTSRPCHSSTKRPCMVFFLWLKPKTMHGFPFSLLHSNSSTTMRTLFQTTIISGDNRLSDTFQYFTSALSLSRLSCRSRYNVYFQIISTEISVWLSNKIGKS